MRAAERQARRMQEMVMTPAQVLAEAVARRRAPKKRYRVEGAGGGALSSHLLDMDDAIITRANYGGQIVELIDEAAYYFEISKGLPICTRKKCAAAAGQPCTTPDGGWRNPHDNRLGLAEPEPKPRVAKKPAIAAKKTKKPSTKKPKNPTPGSTP